MAAEGKREREPLRSIIKGVVEANALAYFIMI
jgi:hypothetical protein